MQEWKQKQKKNIVIETRKWINNILILRKQTQQQRWKDEGTSYTLTCGIKWKKQKRKF